MDNNKDVTPEAPQGAKERSHEDLRKLIARGREKFQVIHDEFKEDRNFYGGDQWGDQAKKREDNGRQSFVYNVMPAFVRSVTNVAKQSPPGIKVDPVSDATADTAKLRQGLIRSIEYQCDAQAAYLYALECAAQGGIGVWRIVPVKSHDGIVQLEVQSILDPTCVVTEMNRKHTLDDVRWVAYGLKMPADTYRQNFPNGTASEGDAPVEVFEFWELVDGRVVQYILDRDAVLHVENDYPGTILPFVFVTGEFRMIDDAWHYAGILRDACSMQKEINYLKSEAITNVANAPKAGFIGDEDAVEGHEEEWENSNRESVAILRKKKGSEVIPVQAPPPPVGYMQLSDQAYEMISQVTGIKPQFGAALDPISGKSVRYQQGQAAVNNYHFLDSLARAIRRTGEILNELLPHNNNDDRIRTVMGDDQSVTAVSFGPIPVPGVQNHDLSFGKYAVTISQGPAYGSQRDALLDQLAEFARMDPEVMKVIAPFFLKTINLPGSEGFADQLKALLPPAVLQVLAQSGDPSAQSMQLNQQLQGAGQQIQQMQQFIGQLQQALKEATDKSSQALQLEQFRAQNQAQQNERDRELKEALSRQDAALKILLSRMDGAHDAAMIDHKAAVDQDARDAEAANRIALELAQNPFISQPNIL